MFLNRSIFGSTAMKIEKYPINLNNSTEMLPKYFPLVYQDKVIFFGANEDLANSNVEWLSLS